MNVWKYIFCWTHYCWPALNGQSLFVLNGPLDSHRQSLRIKCPEFVMFHYFHLRHFLETANSNKLDQVSWKWVVGCYKNFGNDNFQCDQWFEFSQDRQFHFNVYIWKWYWQCCSLWYIFVYIFHQNKSFNFDQSNFIHNEICYHSILQIIYHCDKLMLSNRLIDFNINSWRPVHIYASVNQTIIGSDNGFAPIRCQAII